EMLHRRRQDRQVQSLFMWEVRLFGESLCALCVLCERNSRRSITVIANAAELGGHERFAS
ncbi:hypothetical protein JXA80_03160, partial [bacterium]|nr:hypothetical protein [candidate division CSSED10-310 bacterium]